MERRHQVITAGVALSLTLHAGGVGVMALVGSRERAIGSTQVGSDQGLEFAINLPAPEAVPPKEPTPTPPPPSETPPEPPAPTPPEVVPPELQELFAPLGIEDALKKSKAWIGAREETENLAPKSKVDQAARTLNPSAGGEKGGEGGDQVASAPDTNPPAPPPSPETAAQTPSSQPADSSQPSEVTPQTEPKQEKPVQELEKQEKPEQSLPVQLQPQQLVPKQDLPKQPEAAPTSTKPSDLELPAQQPQDVQPLPVQPEEVQEKPLEPEKQQLEEQQLKPVQPDEPRAETAAEPLPTAPAATPATQPPSPPTPPASAKEGFAKTATPLAQRGKKSEDESQGASIQGSLVYKPGEPLAGPGLRILTVRPSYAVTTQVMARPRNTVVIITFGRDGRVLRAVFKDNKGTGYADVDKPLLDAIYRWKARGEVLEKIPADKPQSGITYSITLLMDG